MSPTFLQGERFYSQPEMEDATVRLKLDLASLRAKLSSAEREIERLRVYEPSLRKFEVHENGRATAEIRVPHEFRETLALNLAAVLADAKAINYIETNLVHPEQGAFAMTIQRCAGKSPGRVASEEKKRAESAEARLSEAVAVLRECHEIMLTWFSSEYTDHPTARRASAFLAASSSPLTDKEGA